MAKDLFGLLNGLRKVAVAFSSEIGSELQAISRKASAILVPQSRSLKQQDAKTTNEVISEDEVVEKSQLAKEFEELTKYQQSTSGPPTNRPPTNGPPTNSKRYHTWSACWRVGSRRSLHTSAVMRGGVTSDTIDAGRSKRRNKKQKIHHRARERAVPASRLSRLVSFGGLAAGLGLGTATEVAKRAVGLSQEVGGANISSAFLSEGNMERIVSTLCRVRGAALKIGQIISLQDGSLVPEPMQEVFERVRNNADFMPTWQLESVLVNELGKDWRSKVEVFEPHPLAAASIGQVHRAVLKDGREVAMKIQYPGVAQSIDSDIDNLMGVLKVWNILPEGLFVDDVIAVARRELAWEVDYEREAECGERFRELLADDPRFGVPTIVPELSTKRVLTAELIHGLPLDQCHHLPQTLKNDISERIISLCLRELFEFRFMQTDPNWSNFYFNETNNKIFLLDFGASREYSNQFTDKYVKVIHAAVMGDNERVIELSKNINFITGYESKAHIAAYLDSLLILGEPFRSDTVFDFGSQDTTARVQRLLPSLLYDRLTPPPEECYSLHRKMAGSFLLCARLQAKFNCYNVFQKAVDNYQQSTLLA